jgi:hypothetical protein
LFLYHRVGSRTLEVVNKMLCQVLVIFPTPQRRETRADIPKSDAQPHDGLCLEAVRLGCASPVAQIEPGAHLVQVLARALHEGVGGRGVDFVARLFDDIAVQEGHGLAECDGAHDEGDQEQGVDGRHYQQAEVRKRPVVADADHDIERCDASLGNEVSFRRWEGLRGLAYDAEGADEFFRGLDARGDDHLDEVGGDADDDYHGEGLQNADEQEHLAQRHGTVARDRHLERLKWGLLRRWVKK